MKKFLVMAAMVLSSVGAFAQYSAGDITIQPKVGLNCASVTDDVDGDYKAGFVGGVEAEYHINKLIGISAGLLYSTQGCKWSNDDHNSTTWSPGYLNIPVLANFYVAKGLAVKGGLQPGFMVAKDDAKKVKTFDLSIPVGISYEFANICLDARYNAGVTKVFDHVDGNNSVFQLTLGYKFKL